MIIKYTTTRKATKDMIRQFKKLTFSHGSSGLRDEINICIKNNENGKIWYIEEDGKIVGWCLACIHDQCFTPFLWSGYYVNVKYRNKGHGRALFLKVLEFAEKKDIRVEVYSSCNAARHIFATAPENMCDRVCIVT
jgi:GNAT superfamily N-acetyltransferase